MIKYKLDDTINNKKVKDLTKQEIKSYIKKGYNFDDEVLSNVGLTRTVRDIKYNVVIAEHEKSNKVYEKDTMRLSSILKSLHTIDSVDDYNDIQFERGEQLSDEMLLQ